MAVQRPRTIEELRQWYVDHNLPPMDVTRFFIGIDTTDARAFGIYYDSEIDRFTVYKNKDDGSRAVRYCGPDEAMAVGILFDKLCQEITVRKQGKKAASAEELRRARIRSRLILFGVIAILIAAAVLYITSHHKDGYYVVNGTPYYCLNDSWYWYDGGYWYPTYESYDWDWSDYYYGSYYGDVAYSFTDTKYYEDYVESQQSRDDYSWDSGDSWDSGSTDWGSDW